MRRIALALTFAVLLAFASAVPANAGRVTQPTIAVVDTSGGALRVAEAAAAWSKNTGVRLTVTPACGTGPCFTVQWDTTNVCAIYQTGIIAIGGCARGNPCQVYVTRGVPDYTLLRFVTHELGHCLGLPHNTSDPRSIMQPAPVVDRPDAGDRAAVRAIY